MTPEKFYFYHKNSIFSLKTEKNTFQNNLYFLMDRLSTGSMNVLFLHDRTSVRSIFGYRREVQLISYLLYTTKL